MKNPRFFSVLLFLILAPIYSLSAQVVDPFEWSFDDGVKQIQPGGSIPLKVTFQIPPKHFLYRDKISLSFLDEEGEKDLTLGPMEFSPSMQKKDPFLGKELEIFEGGAVLQTTLKARPDLSEGKRTVRLLLTYQGCSDNLCYRFNRKEISFPLEIETTPLPTFASAKKKGTDFFRHGGFLLLLLMTFLAGLGSDFTPCVLPIIPITLAFIGVRKEGTLIGRNFVLTLFFVFSMAITYAFLGLAAALLGKSLGFLFQNVYFLLFTALLFLFFSLSLFGLFEFQFPLSVRNFLAKMGGAGIVGSIISGLTVGFLAAPCVGPLIASLLLYVAQDRNLPKGFLLLFSYGLGMGSLFLLVGTFYHRFAAKVHGGTFTVWIKRIFAVILLIPAFYYGKIAIGHFKTAKNIQVTQEDFWGVDAKEGFAKGAREGKPIFLDFFATWCLPCVEMETKTFSNDNIQQLLLNRFVPIKIDCTQETAQCKEMVEKYSVVGWPTFLILNSKGEVVETLVGKNLKANELMDVLEKSLEMIKPYSE